MSLFYYRAKLKCDSVFISLRDWGYAKDYVECMWLIMQQEKFFGCIGIQINSIINVIRFINIGSKQRKLC